MEIKGLKKNSFWVLYYLCLIVLMISWTNQETSPNIVFRIVFLAAIIWPCFIRKWFCPPVFTCFLTLSALGFSLSYLPSSLSLIALTVFIVYFVNQNNHDRHIPIPVPVIVLVFFITIIDIINGFQVEKLTYCLIIVILFCGISEKGIVQISSLQRLSIIIACISICILFIVFRERFTFDYQSASTGLERVGWTDPNYFGTTIGMAAICAISTLMFEPKNKIRILCVICIVLSIIIMLMVASRGAALSLGICVLLVFLSREISIKYKVLALFLMGLLLLYLYKSNFFELLLYRVEMDDTGGSGRFNIWTIKLRSFFSDCNAFEWLFGIGFRRSNYLGFSESIYNCIHNDVINFLIAYGFVGLIMYITMLFAPIHEAIKNKSNKSTVIIGIIFLFVSGLTIQPLCEGYMAFYCYYYYLWLIAQSNNKQAVVSV